MYYSFPEAEESYAFQATQYMFGDDMLIAPITEAASKPVNASLTKTVWLPEGTWTDWVSQLAAQNPLHCFK
jgi:alpha-glucosidase (family GH31 glycosyl hydrolase)